MEELNVCGTHLFVHSIPLAEDDVSANEPCNERVRAALLAPAGLLLHKQKRLVQRDELGEVKGVLPRCPIDRLQTRLPTALAELVLRDMPVQ